ncbi:22872_t:CDS:1, partial [Gigaspora rosea]
MSNTTPNGNSEIPLELKKILNSLSRNQQSFYNTSANKINFLKAIREE